MTGPALLFDLDGTLLDTDPIHRAVFAEMMAPVGIVVDDAYYQARLHGRRNAHYFAEVFPDETEEQHDARSHAKEAEFRRRLPRPYPAMPGAIDLVARAADAGWPRAVVTNAMRPNATAMLEAVGLTHRFDVVISADDVAKPKPAPDPYLAAMDALGVTADRAIAFEDSPTGLASARASGAYTVAIASSLTPEAARDHGADAVISDFTDPGLPAILARQGLLT